MRHEPRRLVALALLAGLASLCHGSPRFDLGLGGGMPLSGQDGYGILPHASFGVTLAAEWGTGALILPRLELGWATVSPSRPDETLSLYRGWEAWGAALLGGWRTSIASRLEFALLAGGGLSVARYAQTPLAFAFPRALVEGRLSIDIGLGGWRPEARLPMEILFRGETFTLAPSLALAVSWSPATGKDGK